MNDILKKIHSKGYWRVNIRPTIFNEGLVKSFSEARAIMDKCGVLLRGWDFPHFTNAKIINMNNWIESQVEFEGHIEYWRFYLTGQF